MHQMIGMLKGARGCCPSCGRDVARRHAWNGTMLTDTYACVRCGPTEYAVRVLA